MKLSYNQLNVGKYYYRYIGGQKRQLVYSGTHGYRIIKLYDSPSSAIQGYVFGGYNSEIYYIEAKYMNTILYRLLNGDKHE